MFLTIIPLNAVKKKQKKPLLINQREKITKSQIFHADRISTKDVKNRIRPSEN